MAESYDYLYKQISRLYNGKISPSTCKKVILGFTEVLSDNLRVYEVVTVPNLGVFSLKDFRQGGKMGKRYDFKEGKTIEVYMPERKVVTFSSCENMKLLVNGDKVRNGKKPKTIKTKRRKSEAENVRYMNTQDVRTNRLEFLKRQRMIIDDNGEEE